MKFFLVFFIIAGIIFSIGVGSLSYNTSILLEKYPDLQVVYDGVLDSGQQISTPISVAKGEKITISILADGKSPLYFYIEDEKEIIIESIFSEKMSHTLFVNQTGTYIIGVGNMGDIPIEIHNYLTENPIFDTELIKELSDNSIISYVLITISMVLFVIGLAIIFIKKIINKVKHN